MEPPPILPEDLQKQILSLLPVKSLVRFTCVSKPWNSTISDSQFIKLHLRRSSSTKDADFPRIRSLVNSPLEESRSAIAASSVQLVPGQYDLIGTCNGLICLRGVLETDLVETIEGTFTQIRIWNPATRSMSQRSPPDLPFSCVADFGFGYDGSSDTFKVVELCLAREAKVRVCNMGDDRWRKIRLLPLPPLSRTGNAAYVSNTLNWLATRPDLIYNNKDELVKSDPYTVFSFDLGKENCAQLALPNCPRRRDEFKVFVPVLGVLRDCLCVCQNYKNMHFDIWQMKDFGVHESWTMLFNISGYPNISFWNCFAMYMSEDGDALLLSTSGACPSQAVLCTKKDNKIEDAKSVNKTVDCYAMNYFESLVSPC